jgi:iron-sulfur cluster insertion protein
MTFVESPTEFDTTFEKDGLKVHIDAVALGFLEGVEVDYQTEGASPSFVFKNVFANTDSGGSCGGCGSAGGGGCG